MKAKEMFEKSGYEFKEILYDDNSRYAYEYSCGGKRFVFQDIDKKGIVTDSVKYISSDELKAIIQQVKELGWLEDEKKESKKETNLEHYFEYLSIVGISDFALINGRDTQCSDTYCGECDFNGDCCKKKLIWLASPYEKPTYKLTQFEHDLLNTFDRCKECCLLNEIECLKKLSAKGYFKGIDPFTKVHDIIDNCEVIK